MDILKILSPFGKMNKKNSSTKSQIIAKQLFNLLGCLRYLEGIHNDIVKERKRNTDHQNSTKSCLSEITPSLENIVLVLRQPKKQRDFNINLLHKLCDKLDENINALRIINSTLLTTVHITSKDIAQLVKVGGVVLNELVKNVFSCVGERKAYKNKRFKLPRRKTKFRNIFNNKRKTIETNQPIDIQSTLQCLRSNNSLKCDDLWKNILDNVKSNNISGSSPEHQVFKPSHTFSTPLRKRIRTILSTTDGEIEDDGSHRDASCINIISTNSEHPEEGNNKMQGKGNQTKRYSILDISKKRLKLSQ